MVGVANQVPRSARAVLVTWANQQGDWVRSIVCDVLSSRSALTNDRIAEVYEQFIIEKQLAPGDALRVPAITLQAATADGTEALTLLHVDSVENVNALTSGQKISFNTGLTVVFGRNGSGKSGYVRILKRVARVRAAENVLPNVASGKPSGATQRARISYRQGTTDSHIDWTGEEGVHPLTRLDVFDARAIALHVDEDLTYVYTPSDLALFRFVHDAIESVRGQLDTSTKSRNPTSNPSVHRFSRESTIYPKIESLGAATGRNQDSCRVKFQAASEEVLLAA